jgi:FKBP-type peptidyl-prolyl cis-trans isomerase FkpA
MMKHKLVIVIGLFTLLLGSCVGSGRQNHVPPKKYDEQTLIKLNKQLVEQERKRIDAYIARHGLHMKITPTGLRYQIIRHGKGVKAEKGKIAVIRYRLSLLSGKVVASSAQNGLKSFEIGHGGVENGLEEGILLLKVGDKAKFILPSHLAYGLSGDGDKIPPHSPLVYEIEFVQIN